MMKCVICKSDNIEKRKVKEEIKKGTNIELLSLEILVCLDCGERYYDRKTMHKIEETQQQN